MTGQISSDIFFAASKLRMVLYATVVAQAEVAPMIRFVLRR